MFACSRFGVLDCLLHAGSQFGTYVSLAGGTDAEFLASVLSKQKLFLFHGGLDTNVSIDYAYRLKKAIEGQGKVCSLKIFPDAGHPIMNSVCQDPNFLAFLGNL